MASQFKSCEIDECNRNAHKSGGGCRGFCRVHYRRLLRHGDPTLGRTPDGAPRQWLLAHTQHSGDDCLIWPFHRSDQGYGQIREGNRQLPAHRVMCTLVNGPPPTEFHEAAHNCGNGHEGCCHPKHLRWATGAENQADRLIHGTDSRGTKNYHSVLCEADVLEIRRLEGVFSHQELAGQYNVHKSSINDILNGRTWTWL